MVKCRTKAGELLSAAWGHATPDDRQAGFMACRPACDLVGGLSMLCRAGP